MDFLHRLLDALDAGAVPEEGMLRADAANILYPKELLLDAREYFRKDRKQAVYMRETGYWAWAMLAVAADRRRRMAQAARQAS